MNQPLAHTILIQNGNLVLPAGVVQHDLLIQGDTITDIQANIPLEHTASGTRVIDARDKYVLPGGIDVHTHLNLDIGIARAQDDFYTGTVAAAMGGTTTIVDHPGFGPKGCSIFHQIAQYHEYARDHAVIDYAFHGVLQHLDETIIEDLPKLVGQGITSVKAYMTYDHRFTDEMLARLLKTTAAEGILVTVHAEDHDMISANRQACVRKGQTAPRYHAQSRPPESEANAVSRVIQLAKDSGDAPLYIVHLSTQQGLDVIRTAQAKGQPVFAETCPQYLFLDASSYDLPDLEGLKYIMSPPLRSRSDQSALWHGLSDGSIQVVATDHCPFDFALKKRLAAHDFTRCPGGAPGIEARIPLMFSKAMTRQLTLEQCVKVTAENPARIMGLYPQKGVLAQGSDADLVIMDPDRTQTITHDLLHENVDYTPYEGFTLAGIPILTMVRGHIITENGQLKATKGFGTFIKRKRCGGKIG